MIHQKVYGNAIVKGDGFIVGDSEVYDNAIISNGAIIAGASRVYGNAIVHGTSTIIGCNISGDVQLFDVLHKNKTINCTESKLSADQNYHLQLLFANDKTIEKQKLYQTTLQDLKSMIDLALILGNKEMFIEYSEKYNKMKLEA